MNTRQRINRKNLEKIAKKNSGEAPTGQRVKVVSRGIFRAKFACYAAGGIRTHDLPLARNPLYYYTTLSLVSRFRFGSPYIILNQV
jgi:hypothetical protein